MNASTSECSSGCESGWTTYLSDYTKIDVKNYEDMKGAHHVIHDDDDEEDLSMLSDASSGPPNFSHAHAPSLLEGSKIKKGSKSREVVKLQCLDDTATSPMLHFSLGNAVPPHQINLHKYSVDHQYPLQDVFTPKKRLGFLKSSTKGISGSFVGRKKQ